MPAIECWAPRGPGLGIGIVIMPGGGYCMLAEHEGRGYAEHFGKLGIACFVVTYRLGSQGFRHPAMLEDALAAMGTVRARAGEFGIKPDRIGIMGSSAGGHLAAHTLVAYDRYPSAVSLRPDFGILCYPVIALRGPHCHSGSMEALLGRNPSQELLDEVDCVKHVTARTPPCFLWHTVEDDSVPVENSMMFASALRSNGVAFELHVYAKGSHGLGLGTPFKWADDCFRWLKESHAQSAG